MLDIAINYSELIIIGNGFDINIGLKTRYIDYIESEICKNLHIRKNLFISRFKSKSKERNWIDIENELKVISDQCSGDIHTPYKELCKNFCQYIIEQNKQELNTESKAYKFLKSLMGYEFLILDFNYTDTTKRVLENVGFSEREIQNRLIKVHGSAEEKKIIFGVEDLANIKPEHVFLKKSYSPYFQAIDLYKEVKKIKTIKVFGHSLGETDHMYFDKLFASLIDESSSDIGKSIIVYYYGEEGYKNLHMQLENLTQKGLYKLKRLNNFIPEDIG